MLQPSSPQALAIHGLSVGMLWLSVAIFSLITLLIFFALWRSRRLPEDHLPERIHGKTKLEVLWVVIPLLIVLTLFFFTVRTMHAIDPGADPGEPDIVITGHQWWWEIEYPKRGIRTANEIHIPVGKKLLLRLEAADVIHSFWVPALNYKMDLIPGHSNYLYLQADKPGVYPGVCAEFCGLQHAGMRITVVAEPETEFLAWQEKLSQPTAAALEGPAAEGFRLYTERTCITCHSTAAGPDLKQIALRRTLGSGVMENNRENLIQWLMDPHRFKPGSLMPNLGLTYAEAAALTDYLRGGK
jgi:cytochrome c oxidase subunit 2